MQHEIDHLDGMLFIFRMSGLKRDLNLRKIRKCNAKASGRAHGPDPEAGLLRNAPVRCAHP